MSTNENIKIIDGINYLFTKDAEPFANAKIGEVLQFNTQDCFGCQIKDESQLVTEIDMDIANPVAGPVYFEGAEIGDILVVDVLDIEVGNVGFACSVPELGPLCHLAEPRTRLFNLEDGYTTFNDVRWELDPMIGVIGTAPSEESCAAAYAGNHGGNMDSNRIRKGCRVYLPVRVSGALLQMGDLHATMGDGELCGTGIETSGKITVSTSLIKNMELNWVLTETDDMWYVNSTGEDYSEALIIGCTEMARLIEKSYGWDATDTMIYLSVQGCVEINQAVLPAPGHGMINLRIGVPKLEGKNLI